MRVNNFIMIQCSLYENLKLNRTSIWMCDTYTLKNPLLIFNLNVIKDKIIS
jgi:hypothetical protein